MSVKTWKLLWTSNERCCVWQSYEITKSQECAVQNSNVNATGPASTSQSVTESVNVSASQVTPSRASVLTTTAIRTTKESIANNSMPSSPNTAQQITQSTPPQPPVKVITTAAAKSGSTKKTTQASTTQLAQNESLSASSTEGSSFSSRNSLQNTTPAPGTSTSDSPRSSPGNKEAPASAIHYSSVTLPIVITLIVITLSVFSLVALYRMCQKKTPERQENGTEQAQSDKEGVKLLSVKTTSPETGCQLSVSPTDISEVAL
ncbi:endomucin [Pelecanus crispus]|uniref:endomucin n=1 Tax=Pelecanus crispus TaxID=36300 RepID=UPI003F5D4B78